MCRISRPRIEEPKGDGRGSLLTIKKFEVRHVILFRRCKDKRSYRKPAKQGIPEVFRLERLPYESPLQVRKDHIARPSPELPIGNLL